MQLCGVSLSVRPIKPRAAVAAPQADPTAQRLQVALCYIHRRLRNDMVTPLRTMYITYNYMEPLGRATGKYCTLAVARAPADATRGVRAPCVAMWLDPSIKLATRFSISLWEWARFVRWPTSSTIPTTSRGVTYLGKPKAWRVHCSKQSSPPKHAWGYALTYSLLALIFDLTNWRSNPWKCT